MPHLTPSQLGALRARLVARSDVLRRELAAALHEPSARMALGLPNRHAEVDDDAVAEQESLLDIAAVQRDAHELADITAAFDRLHDGSYGRCVACSHNIPWPRLNAQPQAPRCIACEAEHERLGVRPGSD